MNKSSAYTILICAITLFFLSHIHARSVYRLLDPLEPQITVSWHQKPDKNIKKKAPKVEKYVKRDSHIEPYPIFKVCNEKTFQGNLLPENQDIVYRNMKNYSVKGHKLSQQIEHLLGELKKRKKKFTHFVVLQDKNFSYRKHCGLLVLRFKKHPFVLKLFIETPKTFVDTHNKGIEPIVVFHMGAGANRHITGLTRLKNLEVVKQKIQKHPQWSPVIDFPRKWFWLPKDAQWIDIEGKNIGSYDTIKTSIPSVYAIVADAIECDKRITLFDKKNRKKAMELCNYLNLWIDPHIDNFMPEKGTGKIVIVDTEHFPTFVGLKEPVSFSGYISWYTYLAMKCVKNIFFRTKKKRREDQLIPHQMALI